MFVKLFILSMLLHIIDDFVLQPVCLSKLKQKSFWEQNAPDKLYENDYMTALTIHGLSWSIMIILPYMLLLTVPSWIFATVCIVNATIHAIVDDLKANKHKLNLADDQLIHVIQLLITYAVFLLAA